MMRRAICLLVSVLALAAAPPLRAEPLKELSFGVVATESSAAIKARYDGLFRDLEQALGMPVKFFYAGDYAGMIQAMRFNKVQIARYGNKSAAEAVDRSDGEVAFRAVYDDGSIG